MKLRFKKGLLGFEDLKEYTLTDVLENDIFKELNSEHEENIGFILVSPFDIVKEYEILLDNNTIRELEISEVSDVMLFNIVTLNDCINNSTVNLRAPIIVNNKTKLAKQIILQDEAKSIKYPLINKEK